MSTRVGLTARGRRNWPNGGCHSLQYFLNPKGGYKFARIRPIALALTVFVRRHRKVLPLDYIFTYEYTVVKLCS